MIIVCTIFRTSTEIVQGIVHPAHVPFIVKSKTALGNRIGNFREGSGIFGCEDRRWVEILESLVHVLKELYCIQVYPTSRVALPVDRAADRIHTDTVHVEFTHPVIGTGLQETSCFAAGMHKVAASPFADTDSRVRILIKRSSVIICQTVSVHSEMNRNKVHQHADAVFVAGIHESL